jgi:hypothetical protein
MKVVVLHCTFKNQFELCPKVLALWRYEVKDFCECLVFLFFFAFFSMKTTQNNMNSTHLEEGNTIIVL